MDDLLQQGIIAYKAGKRDEARKIFILVIKQSPNSETSWVWMYQASNNDKERIHCLKQILRINPNSEKAKQKLDTLTGQNSLPETPQKHKKAISTKLILAFISIISLICVSIVTVVYIFTTRETATLPNNVAIQSTAIILPPTAQPTLIPKTETVPSVLKQYGFVVSENNNDSTTYEAPCGSSAILSKNTPEVVAFSIPLTSSVCNLTEVIQPVSNSLYTLYPIAIGDWLLDENRLTYVLDGGTASDEIDGYILALSFLEEDNSLLYFIRAPQ